MDLYISLIAAIITIPGRYDLQAYLLFLSGVYELKFAQIAQFRDSGRFRSEYIEVFEHTE